jgi:hypothetical protein
LLRHSILKQKPGKAVSLRAAAVFFQPASFNRSSYVPFHHVRSYAHCCRAWHPAAKTQSSPGRMHSPLRSPAVTLSPSKCSLGSIAVLRRYFISAGFSPPAASFYCARRPPHLGCVHLAAAIAHSSLISQSIAKVHLHSSAAFVPCGKFTPAASYGAAIAPDLRGFPGSPFVGARRPPP